MTIEEATKCLKTRLKCAEYIDYGYCDSIDLEAIKIAIKALEKQIPMRVTNQEGYYFPPCPSCGRKSAFVGKNNYCEVCGQRLDWGEEQNGNA